MKFSLLSLLLAIGVLSSCKNDKPDGVQQISEGGSNADMVRNPASASMPADTNQLARISYEHSEFDFGQVTEGDVVEHQFKFTNTGKVPLTILKARSTCGCTIPEYPEDPIPPGGTGVISAKFNTEGKHNEQKKIIHVTANTYPSETSVMLKGFVNAPKQ